MKEPMSELEPAGTYRPQYHFRWRAMTRLLDRFPGLKVRLADWARRLLRHVFEPSLVTTERVIEYPFVFQHLNGMTGPILDIGCCHSRLPIAMASRGLRTVGLDFHPYPFRHPNFLAVCGDAMRLPFTESSFRVVVAISVIEHIGIGHYGDPSAGSGDCATVCEIARVLRPGGRALITVPFGLAMTNSWMRTYDSPGLAKLLASLHAARVEFAVSRNGVWTPSSEAEAAAVSWNGPDRAIALVVATKP
jgi:SAM-dependent methyltransferase